MKTASHTNTSGAADLWLISGIGLVELSEPDLSDRLAGKESDQLEAFASQMRRRLLTASVSMGLEVMASSWKPRSPTWRARR
jgi:hypothetical protein